MSLGNGTAMKAGVGLVVRSNLTMGPDVGVVDDELEEELHAAEITSSSERRAKRMTAV
jgi:hypothetical protein